MENNRKKRLFAYLMASSLLLSGCAERVNCSISSKHVHKYVKELGNGDSIVRYIESERKNIDNYLRYDDYIEITKDDEEIYKLLADHKLFLGKENWDYLYNLMCSNSDYIEYHYDYFSTQQYKDKDKYGRTIIKERKYHHEGWHTSPNFVHNTGEARICHHKYFGYTIEEKNGKLELVKTPSVDDIGDLFNIYGDNLYLNEDCCVIVYEDFVADKKDLKSTTVNDFTTHFSYPNLNNRSIHTGKIRIRK